MKGWGINGIEHCHLQMLAVYLFNKACVDPYAPRAALGTRSTVPTRNKHGFTLMEQTLWEGVKPQERTHINKYMTQYYKG